MTKNPDITTDRLNLRALEHPATGQRVTVYPNPDRAFQHLRDHVLSAPESDAWRLIWPALEEAVDFDNADARWLLLERGIEDEETPAALQALYDRHVEAVRVEVADATTLGWQRQREQTTVCLGTSGVVTIFEPMVRTAMIPGFGSPSATRRSQALPATSSCMWRHRPMRSGEQPGRRRGAAYQQEDRPHERRWDREQRVYFRVFRPAVQAVRQHYHRSLNVYGQPRRHDMALLKDALPRQSQLKLEQWRQLRRRCGRTE